MTTKCQVGMRVDKSKAFIGRKQVFAPPKYWDEDRVPSKEEEKAKKELE